MQSSKYRNILFVAIVLILVAGSFSGGVIVGWQLPALRMLSPFNRLVQTDCNSNNGTNVDTLFKPFWETWQIVHDQYVDQPVNDVELMRGY